MNALIKIIGSNKKRLVDLTIYFLGIFVLKGASFILTPIYTRVFSTEQYGIIELANSILSFFGMLIGFGLCQYLGIEYFHYKDKDRTLAIEKNIILYITIALPIVAMLLVINSAGLLHFRSLDRSIVNLILIASFFVYFSNLCLMLCKNQNKTTIMTIIQLVTGLITLFMNYMGVCYWGWGIYSILIATVISNIILTVLVPVVYKLNVKISIIDINAEYAYRILRVSIPLAITGLVNSILLLSDRWILNYFCSIGDIGIYSLATKFGGIFELILINTLTIFYSPHIYKSYQELGIKESEKKNRRNLLLYLGICIIGIFFFVIAVKLLFPILIGDKFLESEKYLWLILIGDTFLGAMYFRTYLINYNKKTTSILIINVIAMVFNLVANIILIPKYKVWAAALTTTCSYLLMFLIATVINQKEYQSKLECDD